MSDIAKVPTTSSPWEVAAGPSATRTLQGDVIKFRDGRFYIGKEQRQAADDWRLGVVDLRSYWVRWEDGRPVEHREQTPSDNPERNDLGYLDQSKWENGMNGPQDPWQDIRYLYLIDPKTALTYTFTTQTFGGRRAVAQLASQVARVQQAQPGALPFIHLRWVEMPTQWGKKTKPFFEIVGWTQGVGAQAMNEAGASKTIESGRNLPDLDEEIPF